MGLKGLIEMVMRCRKPEMLNEEVYHIVRLREIKIIWKGNPERARLLIPHMMT